MDYARAKERRSRCLQVSEKNYCNECINENRIAVLAGFHYKRYR